ncbi:unnamed protein product [Boreogadus saida]
MFQDAFIKIIRHEGIKSLWSGLPPTLVMAVPATVIYFTCYDQLCVALKARMEGQTEMAPLFAGAIARGNHLRRCTPAAPPYAWSNLPVRMLQGS